MMNSALDRFTSGRRGWHRSLRVGQVFPGGVLLLVAVALLGLALSEGGRLLQTLTLVQVLVFALCIGCAALGAIRTGPVLRAMAGLVLVMGFTAFWSVRADSSIRGIL